MFFDTLMFDHNAQLKLEVYSSLCTHIEGEYQLNYFAELHALTYHQINKIVTEIDNDLASFSEEHSILFDKILQKNGKVIISPKSLAIDKYRYHLLKRSVVFQFLEEVLLGRKISVDDFCKEKGIARSTLYRKLVNLIEFFRDFGIKINYQPVDLTGDEALIRSILSSLFWIGTKGIEKPVFADDKNALEILERNVEMRGSQYNYIDEKQELLVIYVALARLNTGHYCAPKKEWKELFGFYQPFESRVISSFTFPTRESYQSEIYYWYFNLFISQSYSNDLDMIMESLVHILTTDYPNHPVTRICLAFLHFVKTDLGIADFTEEERKKLLANMLSVTFTSYTFAQPLPDLESLGMNDQIQTSNRAALSLRIQKFFETFLAKDEFIRLDSSKELLIRHFSNLIYPYYQVGERKTEVSIGLAIENTPNFFNSIHIFLEKLSFVNVKYWNPEHAKDYDLVIYTSSAILDDFPEVSKSYMWDLGYGAKEMENLYQVLFKLYFEKSTH